MSEMHPAALEFLLSDERKHTQELRRCCGSYRNLLKSVVMNLGQVINQLEYLLEVCNEMIEAKQEGGDHD